MINLILWVLVVVGMAKVFMKAGRQWWEAIIPVYNAYVLLKITKTSVWWLVVFITPMFAIAAWGALILFGTSFGYMLNPIIPFIAIMSLISLIVLGFVVPSRLSRMFGHGAGMSLGLIFLPFIFYPILGFDKSVYQKPIAVPLPPTPSIPPMNPVV